MQFLTLLVKMDLVELTEDQLRQFIDAESAFRALEQAQRQANEARGSMFWRGVMGREYLIRATTGAKQSSATWGGCATGCARCVAREAWRG